MKNVKLLLSITFLLIGHLSFGQMNPFFKPNKYQKKRYLKYKYPIKVKFHVNKKNIQFYRLYCPF